MINVLLLYGVPIGGTELPVILFNNGSTGINYAFLDGGKDVIYTENSTKGYGITSKVKSLDINMHNKYMVWTSAEYPNPIYLAEFRSKLNTSDGRQRFQVFKRSLVLDESPNRHIAIDWIHDLIFYVHSTNIKVIHVNNPEVGYEVTNDPYTNTANTGQIAVNPFDGFIVWTEYVSNIGWAVIRKCNEDGTDHQILVYKDIRLQFV